MPLLIFPEKAKRFEFQRGGKGNKFVHTVKPENGYRFKFFDLNFGIVFHFTGFLFELSESREIKFYF